MLQEIFTVLAVAFVFLFVCSKGETAMAESSLGAEDMQVQDRFGHGAVTVQFWPRSQWDPQQTFVPARIVVTRAIRVCQTYDAKLGECTEMRDAWSTVLCRRESWAGYMQEAKRRHRLPHPHLYELYHTYDNLTYEEVPLWAHDRYDFADGQFVLEDTDRELLMAAKEFAEDSDRKMVVRWDLGHYWTIPDRYRNFGERALVTGMGVRTVVQQVAPELLETRPTYIPMELYGSSGNSNTRNADVDAAWGPEQTTNKRLVHRFHTPSPDAPVGDQDQ